MSINGGNFALESACEKTINKTNLLYDEIWKKTIENYFAEIETKVLKTIYINLKYAIIFPY